MQSVIVLVCNCIIDDSLDDADIKRNFSYIHNPTDYYIEAYNALTSLILRRLLSINVLSSRTIYI